MKTLGLLGGMSWESTATYYRLLNEAVRDRCGGLHSAKLLLASVDFAPIAGMMRADRWHEAGVSLSQSARVLEGAGAEALVLCTNTLHKVAPQIEAAVSIPLLHIVDPTAAAITAAGFERVGLIATRFTMEAEFYVDRLRQRGLEPLIPGESDRIEIHRIIFEELVLGRVLEVSRRALQQAIARLAARGAQGVIFGCTEIGLLLAAADSPLPVFDTTVLHAASAADWALEP
ncbi:MAG: aspartate/glutamate racemase family protein [Proteobacteria bacterium]|nr:aspartate/glutamate racemase family protein [Pseudomonadota bacterium]